MNYDPQLRAFEEAHDPLRWSRLRRAGIRILAGHMPYGFTDRFPGRFDYITLLRNPIARAASDYHFSRKTHSNSAYSAARQLSLAEYVDRNFGQSNNCYARWLSNAVFGAVYSSETEMLKAALRNLSQFSYIGITEEFELSVQQLCLKYGLTHYETTNQNRNDATPLDLKLSSEEARAIERGNELDLAIYQHACREQQFRAA